MFFSFVIKKLALATSLSCVCFTALAQNTLRGSVQDASSGKTIPAATIVAKEHEKNRVEFRATPDSNGVFVLSGLPDGVYDVFCTAADHVSQKMVEVPLKDGINRLAYFSLRPGNNAETDVILTFASLQSQLQRTVTTASMNSDAQIDAPATMYVVTAEDIERKGYTSLIEVLADIPEIEIQNRANYYTYNIVSLRGIQGGKKFILMLDGVRISSFTSADMTLDKNISIRHAKQIEILLGPAAALYGSDAVSGVINIISQQPTAMQTQGSFSGGSFYSTDNSLMFGFNKKGFSGLINGSMYWSKEANMPKFYRSTFDWYWNRYQTEGVMHTFGDTTDLITLPVKSYKTPRYAYWVNAKFNFKGFEFGFHRDWQQHNMAIGGNSGMVLAWKEYPTISSRTHAYFSHVFQRKKWSWSSLLNWNWYELSPNTRFADSFNRYNKIFSYSFNHTWQKSEVFSYEFSKAHKLQVGLTASFTHELPNGFRILPIQAIRGNFGEQIPQQYYAGSQTQWIDGRDTQITQIIPYAYQVNTGLFAQYKLNLNDKFLLFLGARFDYFIQQYQSYPAFNPRLGVVYKPHQNWTVKGFYGESFMAPALETMYGDYTSIEPVLDSITGLATGYTSDYAFIPNLNLRPEKMRSGELGAFFAKDNWLASVNGYVNFLSNAVGVKVVLDTSYLQIPVGYGEQNANGASLLTYGGTARLAYRFAFGKDKENSLDVSASYSFSYGQEKDLDGIVSLGIPYSAMHTLKGNLSFLFKGFSIRIGALYRSRSYDGGIYDANGDFVVRYNDPFVVLNLHAYYKILNNINKNQSCSVFVKVSNLTNARYFTPGINFGDTFFASPQDPIRIMGGVSFSFGR